jgi:hypothetical protein
MVRSDWEEVVNKFGLSTRGFFKGREIHWTSEGLSDGESNNVDVKSAFWTGDLRNLNVT